MRNILKCYQLCKYIYDNAEYHLCKDINCDAFGEIGAIYEKHKIFKKQGKKEFPSQLDRLLLMSDFASGKGYIEELWCDSDKRPILKLTDAGIRLTDNLLLPFTPVNLWKEIWKEQYIVITIIYSLIISAFGGGVYGIYKLITSTIARV